MQRGQRQDSGDVARMDIARPGEMPIPTPRELYEHLNRYVVGQRAAKRAIALAAYNHLRRIDARRMGMAHLLRKSNVLLIGPTGCGKTLLARHLAGILQAPISFADATELTEAGYYGRDVETLITDLYMQADRSVEKASRGIVFLDEVDKLARRSQGAQTGAGGRDIGGEGVQQSLLKLLEGREVWVPAAVNPSWGRSETVQIDTTDILFVCAGTFTDLHHHRSTSRNIGFGSGQGASGAGSGRIQHEELMEYGMLAEFLGRLPVVAELHELNRRELKRVLVEPEDSVVREFRQRLALEGFDLEFRPAALDEIVDAALQRKVGARGLRAILEDVMADVLFDAPEKRGVRGKTQKVVVDRKFVRRKLKAVERD